MGVHASRSRLEKLVAAAQRQLTRYRIRKSVLLVALEVTFQFSRRKFLRIAPISDNISYLK